MSNKWRSTKDKKTQKTKRFKVKPRTVKYGKRDEKRKVLTLFGAEQAEEDCVGALYDFQIAKTRADKLKIKRAVVSAMNKTEDPEVKQVYKQLVGNLDLNEKFVVPHDCYDSEYKYYLLKTLEKHGYEVVDEQELHNIIYFDPNVDSMEINNRGDKIAESIVSLPEDYIKNGAIRKFQRYTGKEAVKKLRTFLAIHNVSRTDSKYLTGGEERGWTDAYGSTGFSIRKLDNGKLDWHVVVSGKKAGLKYYEFEEERDGEYYSMHEPKNPKSLIPRVKKAFKEMGLDPEEVRYTGYQRHWDDDVSYNVVTERPKWLTDEN